MSRLCNFFLLCRLFVGLNMSAFKNGYKIGVVSHGHLVKQVHREGVRCERAGGVSVHTRRL